MLAMRRTLWAVPRELVPVVFAAATRAVAATQRKRLEGFVRDSGVSTRPRALDHARGQRGRRRGRHPRRGDDDRGDRGRAPAGEEAPLRLRQVGGRAERRRARAAANGDGGSPRAGPAAWVLDQPAVPLGDDRGLARRPDRGVGGSGGAGRAGPPLARGLRAGQRARHALVDRLDAAGDARGSRRGATHRGRPRRQHGLCARRRPRADAAARAVCGPAADARPDDDGLEGARLVPRRARRDAVRLERQRRSRPSGGTGASSAAGRSGATARSRSGCSKTSAATLEQPSTARSNASGRGSATSASRRASCRPSSAPSQANADWTQGRGRNAAAFRGLARGGIRSCGFRHCAATQSLGRKISFAITSRWICEVPS